MWRSFALLLSLAGFTTLGACSLLNSPADEKPFGTGGAGGSPMCGDCAAAGDDCNEGVCNAATGKCETKPKANGAKCDDGDFCTDGDACHAGKCVGGNAHVCPGKDDCHPGVCNKDSQKCATEVAADNAPCDDGDPCDAKGACMSGKCMIGARKCGMPPYTTTCQTGTCAEGQGCVTTPNMNMGTTCAEGIDAECSTGACDNNGKCVGTLIAENDKMPCESGKFCLVGTLCTNGKCSGGVPRTCPTSDPCSPAVCDEGHGVCDVKREPEGKACSDGNFCHVGMTCKEGLCKDPAKTITTCGPKDKCCPTGCSASGPSGDNDCFYWKTGVQQNVPVTALDGWTLCFEDTYDGAAMQSATNIPIVDCTEPYILEGCGQVQGGTFTTLDILAMGAHDDVFNNDCGTTVNCTRQANGVGFYFSDVWSFGFAPGGADVERNQCDEEEDMGDQRMCVHTIQNPGFVDEGYRCGNNYASSTDYVRVFYQSTNTPPN